jgi:hypothetical protein
VGGGNCVTFEEAGENTANREIVTRPCCQGGSCGACKEIAGDMPWLKPAAIACGRTKATDLVWNFHLATDELDFDALPGRPPHTITCVRSTGPDSVTVLDTSDLYDIVFCLLVGVEITVRDCCGFTYCLHSQFSDKVRVPLCAKACTDIVRNTMAYVKTRVRLNETITVPLNGLVGSGSSSECPGDTVAGTQYLPSVHLTSTLEVCLVRLLPYATLCG